MIGRSSHPKTPAVASGCLTMGAMMNRATGVLFALSVGACGVGDDDNELPNTPEPRLCSANLAIIGTFTLGAMVPDDVNNETGDPPGDGVPDFSGCWPTGTWTWTMTVSDNTCATPPAPAPSYSFRTDFVPDANGDPQYQYTLLAPQNPNYTLKVSSGGGGLCEGLLELFSPDGLQSWNLHPTLNSFNMNGPLAGSGEYAEWRDNQIPTP